MLFQFHSKKKTTLRHFFFFSRFYLCFQRISFMKIKKWFIMLIFLFIITFCIFYSFFNTNTINHQHTAHNSYLSFSHQNPIFNPSSIKQHRLELGNYGLMEDLVIVAGHAIFSHSDYKQCTNENHWRLQQFQKTEHHLSAFLSQIALGLSLIQSNPRSILIFSGGCTRTDVGSFSEAQTYWKVAQNCDYEGFHGFAQVQKRVFTEDYAMDSFQNVLFSICRFHEITGNYPRNITIISWSYKQHRFEYLHRKALYLNDRMFKFIGEDGNVNVSNHALKWERMAIESFTHDMYGCMHPLSTLRIKRNPYLKSLPYPKQCKDIQLLFDMCNDGNLQSHDQLHKIPWYSTENIIGS